MTPLALLAVLHFVCPLLFFTDLTRNPYVTQIALLNVGVLAAAAWSACLRARSGALELPRTPVDVPLAVFAGLCLLSSAVGFLRHPEFFRSSMAYEAARAWLFLLTNAVLVFYLAAAAASSSETAESPDFPAARWTFAALAWGALWLAFPQLRAAPGPMNSIWQHFWDPYGAALWIPAGLAVAWASRRATVHGIWHVALMAGLLASVYAVFQYFGKEFLWPKVLNPYGGRSVSTFGNPNFMSSYQVMLLPLAVTYYLQSRDRWRKAAYGFITLMLEVGLFCSLTRSSWGGAAAALAPLALSRRLRRRVREDAEFHGMVAAVGLAVLLFWPQSSVEGYSSSLLGRLAEIKLIFTAGDELPYSPWYQRVLIWLCSWRMGAEAPLLGKGFGFFELFYPFYQGHYLDHVELFRIMRTHANNSHNEILEHWAQTGILGLGALIWLWTAFFRGAWSSALPARAAAAAPAKKPAKGKGDEADDGERIWILAGSASCFGMLVDNLLNVSLHFTVPAFLFWWNAGTVMGLAAKGGGWRRSWALSGHARSALAAFAVAAALAGAWKWNAYWRREVHYFMGFKAARQNHLQGAVKELTKAYEWDKSDVNNNYELANAYARLEMHDKALWAYDESLKANAGYDEIYFNKATVLLRLGRTEEAVRYFRASWGINPHSIQLYGAFSRFFLSGDAAHIQRHRAEAVELLEDAVRFFPDDLNFLNNLGYLYNLGREYDKAEKVYIRVLERNPETAIAEQNLRTSLTQSKHPAPPVLAKLEEYRSLSRTLAAGKVDAQTLELARRVAAGFPESVQARFYQGSVELAVGQLAESERTLRGVMNLQPQNAHVRLNLAQAVARQGRMGEAAELLRSVLAIDPGNAQAKAGLAQMGL